MKNWITKVAPRILIENPQENKKLLFSPLMGKWKQETPRRTAMTPQILNDGCIFVRTYK